MSRLKKDPVARDDEIRDRRAKAAAYIEPPNQRPLGSAVIRHMLFGKAGRFGRPPTCLSVGIESAPRHVSPFHRGRKARFGSRELQGFGVDRGNSHTGRTILHEINGRAFAHNLRERKCIPIGEADASV